MAQYRKRLAVGLCSLYDADRTANVVIMHRKSWWHTEHVVVIQEKADTWVMLVWYSTRLEKTDYFGMTQYRNRLPFGSCQCDTVQKKTGCCIMLVWHSGAKDWQLDHVGMTQKELPVSWSYTGSAGNTLTMWRSQKNCWCLDHMGLVQKRACLDCAG